MLGKIPYKTVETPEDNAEIVCSALQYDDCVVYTDVRHSYIFRALRDLVIYDRLKSSQPKEQGFVDQYGNFYNREVAAKIAFKAKQVPFLRKELFSEDIWYNDGSLIHKEE